MKITLEQIKKANACKEGYRKLAEYVRDNSIEEPFCPSIIIASNGISDTLCVLKWACGDEGLRICREFAIDCALNALSIFDKKYPEDKRPREAVEAAQQFMVGEIPIDELREKRRAAYAAYAAADAAAAYAAADAAYAAYAAADAYAYAAADAAADAADAAAYAAYAAADAYAAAAAAFAAYSASTYATYARKKEQERQEVKLRELIEGCE